MTRTLLLAALALACVASPAMAGAALPTPDGANFSASLAAGLTALGLCALAVGLILLLGWLLLDRREPLGARVAFAAMLAVLVALAVASPASAAEVATVGDKAVIVPWGDWLVALAVSLREPLLTILVPIIAGYVIQAIRKVYPWAALFLSQKRVEMMLEAAVGYGLNAVQGAAKGKTLSAEVAVPVIAKGTQYVIDTAPAAVIKAAGGADGIAARIFRKLDLDEGASEASVLLPAQVQIGAGTVAADELRDADLTVRG